MRFHILALGAVLGTSLAPAAISHAQCMLANPSFELPGSGITFGGWNQFGVVGSAADATHGDTAARVSGQNTGGWDVSAFWQRLDTAPGERWAVTGCVWHATGAPLIGASRAIVNVEWRSAEGVLLDYDSFTVADASTATDAPTSFALESTAAPGGTASTHVLFGVLQAPGDPVPDVFYDEVTFEMLGPPTPEEIQWSDFPGGRSLLFSGRNWRVKGPGVYGPGPNTFGDDESDTWVDEDGRLHVTVRNDAGTWKSTEVVLEEPLGYGDYVFTTRGRVDLIDPQVVLGLFLWQYTACYEPANGWWNPYNEIDVELSRWGNPAQDVSQYVVQPFDAPGNIERFELTLDDDDALVSHAYRWLPDRLEYRTWLGAADAEGQSALVHAWTYEGAYLPRPDRPRVHINFWKLPGGVPAEDQEVVLDAFTFTPAGVIGCEPSIVAVGEPAVVTACPAPWPNPMRSVLHVPFTMEHPGAVTLDVFDASGRVVRRVDVGHLRAGERLARWDGRDHAGRPTPAGVYFFRLRAGVETMKGRFVRITP